MQTFAVLLHRQDCAHGGRSGNVGRMSEADIRRRHAVDRHVPRAVRLGWLVVFAPPLALAIGATAIPTIRAANSNLLFNPAPPLAWIEAS
jgi:hypothetical protein